VEAHFQAIGEVPSVGDFKVFVSHLQKTEQFSGVQGLGFARYVETGTASDQAICSGTRPKLRAGSHIVAGDGRGVPHTHRHARTGQ
jgi:CHASE1-domain containing sensor protein